MLFFGGAFPRVAGACVTRHRGLGTCVVFCLFFVIMIPCQCVCMRASMCKQSCFDKTKGTHDVRAHTTGACPPVSPLAQRRRPGGRGLRWQQQRERRGAQGGAACGRGRGRRVEHGVCDADGGGSGVLEGCGRVYVKACRWVFQK